MHARGIHRYLTVQKMMESGCEGRNVIKSLLRTSSIGLIIENPSIVVYEAAA